jgi:hypothetical protein
MPDLSSGGSSPQPIPNAAPRANPFEKYKYDRFNAPKGVPVSGSDEPDPYAEAVKRWPFLARYSHVYSSVPGRTNLEAWPPGETGTTDYPRPEGLPPDQFGIEIFDRHIRPDDVLGDVVSHGMRFDDPTVKSTYERFGRSLTQQQQRHLWEQFHYAQLYEGERRNFGEWMAMAGLPGMFRGYAFRQGRGRDPSDKANDPNWVALHMYTPEQRTMLDEMMQYLNNLK